MRDPEYHTWYNN